MTRLCAGSLKNFLEPSVLFKICLQMLMGLYNIYLQLIFQFKLTILNNKNISIIKIQKINLQNEII